MKKSRVFQIIIDVLVPLGPFIRKYDGERPFKGWPSIVFRGILPTFLFYWLFSLIPYVGTIIYGLVLIPLSTNIHIKKKEITSRKEKFRTYLLYFTVILIGFGGIWGFIGHTFLADSVAESIGWESGSPFQTELAFYHLGLGLAGIISIWYNSHILIAIIISKSVFWYGAAFTHIKDLIANSNYAYGNIGAPLINDIVYPTLLLTLLFLYLKLDKYTKSKKI